MAMTSPDPTTTMAASPEQKFNAAVKVIRGLPKNGSFQPSHELMLKFYAYFKQATEGPCTSPKPGIWNLVNRRKWEAWSELGEMERETAMLLYVEELKNVSKHVRDTLYPPEIVETMPQTEQVAEFLQIIGDFYQLVDEDSKGLPTAANGDISGLPIATNGDVNGLPVATNGDSSVLSVATNGSVEYSELDKLDHSHGIDGMLRMDNNNDSKMGSSGGESDNDKDDSTDTVKANPFVVKADRQRCTKGDSYSDDGEDGERGKWTKEDGGVCDIQRVDSGSDTDEYVDTSDQIIQPPSRTSSLQGEVSFSAPPSVDGRRETRVRFAPDLNTTSDTCADDGVTSLQNTLHDLTASSSQMLKDRLALGTPIGMSFIPQSVDFVHRYLSESLRVNGSYTSLASLADDSVAGDDLIEEEEEETNPDMLDDEESMAETVDGGGPLSSTGVFDLITSRGGGGGGDEEGSSQAAGGWSPANRGGARRVSRGARDPGRTTEGRPRRGRSPPGSGGGGNGGRGQGWGSEVRIDEQILLAMVRMQQDTVAISHRLNDLELSVRLHRQDQEQKADKKSSWWPFSGMSKTLVFFLVVWPLLAPIIINIICRRRQHSQR